MPRYLALAFAALTFCFGQNVINPTEFAQTLSFEIEHSGDAPKGWGGGPPGAIFVDSKVVHNGKYAVRIDRNATSASTFTAVTKVLPVEFSGKAIELRGFLRTEDVSGYSGLWMRLDGDSGMLALENMQSRQLKGTTAWTEYSITLPLQSAAAQVYFGALSSGTGKTWADDLQLLVDGKPVWEAPKIERPKTILDQDHQFDSGSSISLAQLSPLQVENLKVLGKVWGFLMYHHPRITAGEQHWDYALFRSLPPILAATSRAEANEAMVKWIGTLGAVADCTACASLNEKEVHLQPQVEWLSNRDLLGDALSKALLAIHRNRPAGRKQFYLSLRGVGNPSFDNEPGYQRISLPDAGFQLLALYRFWNMIEYWFPYRDVLGENWDNALAAFIPRIALAKTSELYQRELMALIARVHDTHANLWSSIQARPPVGKCMIPVIVRFIENQAVIAGYSDPTSGPATGMKAGDIVVALDGTPIPELVRAWTPYSAASNEPTRLRDIAAYMTRGDCGSAAVRVRRDGETLELKAERQPPKEARSGRTHDLPGDTFRRLSNDVAYLKLSSVKGGSAASYIDSAGGTKGLIIDIRNYPSDFVVFSIGSLLVERETEFVRFTNGDPANPGAFHWTPPIKLAPAKPHYSGKVIILIDEVSQSNAEYTTMAFRSSPQAKAIGSTTAGADGNVSAIPLPGGFRSTISGIGVFYPDKKPTQRIGILPDIEVKPTIAGIGAGRDEVLEEAIRQILGPDVPAAEIEKMAKP